MSDLAFKRLHHQGIAQPTLTTPAEVVGWFGAMQGQDYSGVKWAVGLRVPGYTDAAIEQALIQQSILRSWVLRGTLHLVAAVDLPWLLKLVAPRLISGNARRYRELELDDATLLRSNDILSNALRDGQVCSRPELFTILEQQGISTQGQRGVYMLQRASLDGLICQGTAPKNVPNFMLLDVPNAKTFPREEALAELARRYFNSHGPATLQDFIWWSGLLTSEAKAALQAVKGELIEEPADYWQSPQPVRDHAPALYLLPGFDEYLLGYRDRSAILDPQYADKVVPGGNGVFYPMMVNAGQVVGTWKRAFKKGAVIVTPTPFETLEAAEAFTAAAEKYAAFLGVKLAV